MRVGCARHRHSVRGACLYLPSQFEETRIEVLQAAMRANPLATLVTLNDAGIVANHIPLEVAPTPTPYGMLRGHIARANPVWREHAAAREALAIFQGPQAYITPSFYPSKATSGEVVPTWDYVVVHARGSLRFVHDPAWLHALVTRLTDRHEAARPIAWKVSDAPARYVDKMLAAIVGFELTVTSLIGKWKISQNRVRADQLGVIDGLRGNQDAQSLEIAEMLAAQGRER